MGAFAAFAEALDLTGALAPVEWRRANSRHRRTGAAAVDNRGVTADVYPRQPGISVKWYTFDITLNDANTTLLCARQSIWSSSPRE